MAETKPRIPKKKAEEEAALAEEKEKKNKLEWLQNLKSQMQTNTSEQERKSDPKDSRIN